ncbi:hypothetical protein EW145_g1810 [Phellinidium pouzarii]|uniref:Flavin reductase like domain-containing protein n=1 Tax=Phellinidium pouzarii TaxID=167371 RepID=A0A4S4LDL6_9AGAM|nr:hypothetical protein EW145_g1810 [Phellinidium pouzarii]
MIALVHRQSQYRGWHRILFDKSSRLRRCLSTTEDTTKDALRKLLREIAQPVAVVTALYPLEADGKTHSTFHGATLSSFTSIALDPHPLIAFSLRIPSRMATSLKTLMQYSVHERIPKLGLVVNLLSSTQADVAHRFARADIFPEPFRITPYTLTADGLPMLTNSLGALSCSLVTCMPLQSLCDADADADGQEQVDKSSGGGIISELFISRVVRVESMESLEKEKNALPLLYHQRRYATTRLLDSIPENKCEYSLKISPSYHS